MDKQITHVWAVYRINESGQEADKAFAEMRRPQDWGDPERWLYKVYAFEAEIDGAKWRNEVHCWGEKPLSEAEHLKLFAPLVAMLIEPSQPVEVCSNTHLAQDDFWYMGWGPLPPVYAGDDDYWGYDDEY